MKQRRYGTAGSKDMPGSHRQTDFCLSTALERGIFCREQSNSNLWREITSERIEPTDTRKLKQTYRYPWTRAYAFDRVMPRRAACNRTCGQTHAFLHCLCIQGEARAMGWDFTSNLNDKLHGELSSKQHSTHSNRIRPYPIAYMSPQERTQQYMDQTRHAVAQESRKAVALVQIYGEVGAKHASYIAGLNNRRKGHTEPQHLKLTRGDKNCVHGLV